MSKMFSGEQKAKLTQIINEGMAVLQEIEDLNAGLNDTVKAIAEEMEIKPAVLNKIITSKHLWLTSMNRCGMMKWRG